ncbi:hypothetical protein M430DRAFT_45865 [Amorphotheca resinae ATCC 22711]|uniref:Uncharacterized protein n=1 Tax=Amorphotheca resinae ATCC 22711 TaxID=857342 RepID=A0A2T3APV4_AMORE|nr:hypothetical protein M430DRAFT_45865 [Amorphotheca resinae ATCC 22711]PSS07039.1 hypothetical protein M430DRAFT_45865 [Amorphotheca resinae ATCC 22711]
MWLRVFEVWLTARLLKSPAFHRAVGRVHKKVHELRYGKDPAEMGGTQIDKPGGTDFNKFLRYYVEELKEQFYGNRKK